MVLACHLLGCPTFWIKSLLITSTLCAQSFSHVQLCNPMDCSLPGSSVHGIFQARIIGVGCHFLFQGIFPTQGLNLHLLCCRWIILSLAPPGKSTSTLYFPIIGLSCGKQTKIKFSNRYKLTSQTWGPANLIFLICLQYNFIASVCLHSVMWYMLNFSPPGVSQDCVQFPFCVFSW